MLSLVCCKSQKNKSTIEDQKNSNRMSQVSVKDFGAIGNGKRDDTQSFQKAVNYAILNGISDIIIEEGTYLLESVDVTEGLRFYGQDGAVLLKKPNSPKFSRMFKTGKPDYLYSSDKDSQPLGFYNLNFNGNLENQGDYSNYKLEQQHLVFFTADDTRKGRLKVEIENCHFENTVADAISVYKHVDIDIRDCTMHNAIRGGVTIIGGYSVVNMENIKITGDIHPSGIDVEIDGKSKYGGWATYITAKNLWIEGDLDISCGRGGHFIADSIYVNSGPFKVYNGHGGKIFIKNSIFNNIASPASYVKFPQDVEFSNCKFHFEGKEEMGLDIHLAASFFKKPNLDLRFKNCRFIAPDYEHDNIIRGLFIKQDKAWKNNWITLNECTFTGKFDEAIYAPKGSSLRLKDVNIEGETGIFIHHTQTNKYQLSLDNVNINAKRKVNSSKHAGNKIELKGMSKESISN